MDKIKINNLEVFANHGVYEEEKKLGQKFLLSATLFFDARIAGQSDELANSVDYGEICHFMSAYMKENTFNLLEAVAENLVKELLIQYEKIKEIQLEIKKPWAPIGLPLDCVSVEIRRKWQTAYIGLGSNLGDKKKHIFDAIKSLEQDINCKVFKVSKFIETKPYGNLEQDDYLNACLMLETLYTPEELLVTLNQIEALAGRERKVKWDSRTLDLDILFYGDTIYNSETLCIPHYDLHNRSFVLEPLYEIAPYFTHPLKNKSVKEMWEEVDDLESRVVK